MAEELIPGLPDDIARECLIRVPYADFRTVSWVCKLWRREVESPAFHHLRRSNGHARSIVAVVQSEPIVKDPTAGKTPSPVGTSNYHLALFDPAADTWRSLPPPIPYLPLFCRVAAAGRKLVVVGGLDPVAWTATDAVHVYDLVSATWRRGARMPGPARSFFACSACEFDGGAVVAVAGGHDGGKNALRSALAYDVAGGRWAPLPEMAEERDECGGSFVGGKFYAVGGYPTESQGVFSTSAEAFDFGTWEWSPVVEEELGGHVADSESTRKAAGFPEEMKSASQMITLEGGGASSRLRLLAVGPGGRGGAHMIYFLHEEEEEEEEEKGNGLKLKWEKMNIPYEYSGHIQAACSLLI